MFVDLCRKGNRAIFIEYWDRVWRTEIWKEVARIYWLIKILKPTL